MEDTDVCIRKIIITSNEEAWVHALNSGILIEFSGKEDQAFLLNAIADYLRDFADYNQINVRKLDKRSSMEISGDIAFYPIVNETIRLGGIVSFYKT